MVTCCWHVKNKPAGNQISNLPAPARPPDISASGRAALRRGSLTPTAAAERLSRARPAVAERRGRGGQIAFWPRQGRYSLATGGASPTIPSARGLRVPGLARTAVAEPTASSLRNPSPTPPLATPRRPAARRFPARNGHEASGRHTLISVKSPRLIDTSAASIDGISGTRSATRLLTATSRTTATPTVCRFC